MSSGEHTVLCLEPCIDGPRHSGGFFYNDCLAASAAVHTSGRSRSRSTSQPRFSRQTWDGGCLPPATVLLDSLWWYVHKRPLDILADALAGRSWGIIMHGLPEQASGLLGDMREAAFVVVPSFWAAGQLQTVRSAVAAGGQLDLRVLYPGWDGRPGLVPGTCISGTCTSVTGITVTGSQNPGSDHKLNENLEGRSPRRPVRIASSSNWTRAKGLVEAACALGRISRNPACPSWIWQAAGTPDSTLIAEAHSGLGPLSSRLWPLGHLDPVALVRLLHGSDIFLHPSGQETFCLSVFEAALAGCRIVARATGGVPEAIQLASLLRRELGLPPAGVHLATAVVPLAPVRQERGAEGLEFALEEAFAAVANPASSADADPAGDYSVHIDKEEPVGSPNPAAPTDTGRLESSGRQAVPLLPEGMLHEFSWRGRLEKLLSGKSDGTLPSLIQPEQVEAP